MAGTSRTPDQARLDRIAAAAQAERLKREQGYREQALRLFPWICGRCGREFGRANLRELTVHHRDHDHDNNPPDGSNWELLCLYCHDHEHSRYVDAARYGNGDLRPSDPPTATHKALAGLGELLKRRR